jgi:hypothetical protein
MPENLLEMPAGTLAFPLPLFVIISMVVAWIGQEVGKVYYVRMRRHNWLSIFLKCKVWAGL